MGFFGSLLKGVGSAISSGIEAGMTKQFRNLYRNSSSQLESMFQTVENQATQRAIILCIALNDGYAAAKLANSKSMSSRSFETFLSYEDRMIQDAARRLLEGMKRFEADPYNQYS